MRVTLIESIGDAVEASAIVFDTLPELGMETMTPGGVEFVLCASALTAQV